MPDRIFNGSSITEKGGVQTNISFETIEGKLSVKMSDSQGRQLIIPIHPHLALLMINVGADYLYHSGVA